MFGLLSFTCYVNLLLVATSTHGTPLPSRPPPPPPRLCPLTPIQTPPLSCSQVLCTVQHLDTSLCSVYVVRCPAQAIHTCPVPCMRCNLSCCCVYIDGTWHAMQKQRQATHVWKPLEANSDPNRQSDWCSLPDAPAQPVNSSANSAVQPQNTSENTDEQQVKYLPIGQSEQLPQKLSEQQQQAVQHAAPQTVGSAVDANHAPRCVSSHLLLPVITHAFFQCLL